jgi:hypothetical protein
VFFSQNMLELAIEIAAHDPSYEDLAAKFLDHVLWIAHAINTVGPDGMWDEEGRLRGVYGRAVSRAIQRRGAPAAPKSLGASGGPGVPVDECCYAHPTADRVYAETI